MYDQYYELTGRPFQLTPDPRFYFESVTHRKALSYLGYGLAQGEGFIVITGEVGAGKTTLVGHLMQTVDPARLTAATIVTTQLGGRDLVQMVAESFGIDSRGLDKTAALRVVEDFLHEEARAGRRCLLVVDEAQNLPVESLEELRMLSNFQLGSQALLQIFLLGQPEFRDQLKSSPHLEQLRQRVIATHHLEPMNADEIEPYIVHRLSKVGWAGRPQFTADAYSAFNRETDGIPRKLNMLATRVLLMGAVEQIDRIDAQLIGDVVADMRGDDAISRDAVMMPREAEVPFDQTEPQVEDEGPAVAENVTWERPSIEPQTEPMAVDMPEAQPVEDAPVSQAKPEVEEMSLSVEDDKYSEHEAAEEESEPSVDDEWSPETEIADEGAHDENVDEEMVKDDGVIAFASLAQLTQGMDRPREELRKIAGSLASGVGESDFRLAIDRIGGLESRMAEQESAIRRLLAMLIDWAEEEDGFERRGRAA